MEKLNLPGFDVTTRLDKSGRTEILDLVRRRYVRLTGEEWVRQHFLNLMTGYLGYPSSLIIVEASVKYNQLTKRFDILACKTNGKPALVVECKSPDVEISQVVFDQVAMYNMTIEAEYLAVTNGLVHYACKIDHQNRTYAFLKDLPRFEMVNQL